ncbi:hypothetical protein HYH03_011741 [Edaphochlamys debaryana]|uniref:Uncharacterized protein n=1 Tax=Edaphochlamys debaryana TaxID=47281 RepID=A0A836BV87_9CHLO|nr:hypothetical protein HYH03_011741 [Edaphochlamys debaryana]|eukprot:KAG2489792.1 hypothetical protein HYH03_011741 [Edaphochlamys debaryana]
MAAATKRLLVVYQEPPAPLEEFLSPNLIDWRITPDLGIDRKREVARSRVHFRYDTRKHQGRLDDDIVNARLWNTTDRVVTIATNLHFSHEPRYGSSGAPRLPPARVGTPVQSLLMRALFKLSPGLEEATNEALASVGVRPGQPYLAAHLRLGGQVGERETIDRHAVKGKSALVAEAEHCAEHIVAARLGRNSAGTGHASAALGGNSTSLAPMLAAASAASNSSSGAAATATGAGAAVTAGLDVPFILLTDNIDLRDKAVKKELGRWLSPDVTPVHYMTQALPSKGHRRRGRNLLGSKSSKKKQSASSERQLSLELLFKSSSAAAKDRKLSKSRSKSKSSKSLKKRLSSKQLLKQHLASMADWGILVKATCLIQSRSGFSHAAYLLGAQRCAAVLEPDEHVDAPMCPIPTP